MASSNLVGCFTGRSAGFSAGMKRPSSGIPPRLVIFHSGAQWLAEQPGARIALVGDWNIAPTDDDVWSPEFFSGKTHVSQPERDAFTAMTEAGYTDVMRPFAPGPGVYTYWDYTQLRFPRKEGMRIDFILASPALICPNMKLTSLEDIREALTTMAPVVKVPEEIRVAAKRALDRMLAIPRD